MWKKSGEINQALREVAFSDSAISIRRAAFSSLTRNLDEEEALEMLAQALKDPVPDISNHATHLLPVTQNKKAIALLADLLQSHEKPFVRWSAVSSLGRMKHVIWNEPADE